MEEITMVGMTEEEKADFEQIPRKNFGGSTDRRSAPRPDQYQKEQAPRGPALLGASVHNVLEKTKPEPSAAGPVLKGGAAD